MTSLEPIPGWGNCESDGWSVSADLSGVIEESKRGEEKTEGNGEDLWS
jgi:hypothetical protein